MSRCIWHPREVLDREEDAALAEIEAALRRDDPAFVHLIEHLEISPPEPTLPAVAIPADPLTEPAAAPAEVVAPRVVPTPVATPERPRLRALIVIGVVFAVALALTGGATALLGPDAGGLVGVLAIMAATMYAYQSLHGCPGRRR